MATTEESACVYSSLILQDGDSPVTVDKIKTMLKAASVDVEPFWPCLFAKAIETLNLKDIVSNVGAGAGVGPAALAGDVAPAAEEKKEEKDEEEEDDDMGFGMFD